MLGILSGTSNIRLLPILWNTIRSRVLRASAKGRRAADPIRPNMCDWLLPVPRKKVATTPAAMQWYRLLPKTRRNHTNQRNHELCYCPPPHDSHRPSGHFHSPRLPHTDLYAAFSDAVSSERGRRAAFQDGGRPASAVGTGKS